MLPNISPQKLPGPFIIDPTVAPVTMLRAGLYRVRCSVGQRVGSRLEIGKLGNVWNWPQSNCHWSFHCTTYLLCYLSSMRSCFLLSSSSACGSTLSLSSKQVFGHLARDVTIGLALLGIHVHLALSHLGQGTNLPTRLCVLNREREREMERTKERKWREINRGGNRMGEKREREGRKWREGGIERLIMDY